MTEGPLDTSQHEIKIDLQGLIRLLAKNLYAESDVFVRELVQNAHDSILRRSLQAQNAPPGLIRIRTNRVAGTITITDNGSGLTEKEVHNYLATIGKSGTNEFRQNLIQKGRQAEATFIGQFGIGLLSAFVVAYKVEVETLSMHAGNPPWLWVSEGQQYYHLKPGTRHEIGTTVTLHISDNYRDMLDPEELRKAIKKYADFIPYQIFLNDEGAYTNTVNAPWHHTFISEQERLWEYFTFCNNRFPDRILEVIPVSLKTPFQVDGVLYISDYRTPHLDIIGMVDIYQERMFITSNNRDILPVWAKFVRGVIDSPHFTPTASRDAIQLDAAAREIKEALGEIIMRHLQQMAERDHKKFERIMEWHHHHVKGMAVEYDDFFDAIADLVPFETNKGPMSLRHYCEQMAIQDEDGKSKILYFSESGSATQYYMLCNAKGLLVINAGYTFEESFLKKYEARHPHIRLVPISGADSKFLFEAISAEEAEKFKVLVNDFIHTIPDPQSKVIVARFKPTSLPAVTVLTADAKRRRELERTAESVTIPDSVRTILQGILEENKAPSFVLYLNADNPTIRQMTQMVINPATDLDVYRVAIQAIYNNAALLAQYFLTPDSAQQIFATSNTTIKLMIDQTRQLNDIQVRLSMLELQQSEKEKEEEQSRHIICMVALPFHDNEKFAYRSVLMAAIREVLEQDPYYWEVHIADEWYFAETIERNVAEWMKRAQAYIADISDLNPNVMMELGYMRWARKTEQPVVLLERRGSGNGQLADLAGVLRVYYPAVTHEEYAVARIASVLKEEFAKIEKMQNLNAQKKEHFLSPILLCESFDAKEQVARMISQEFVTMERFVRADDQEIYRKFQPNQAKMALIFRDGIAALLEKRETHHE